MGYKHILENDEIICVQNVATTSTNRSVDNPIDAVFQLLGFRTFNAESVQTNILSDTLEDELNRFSLTVDDPRTAYNFFAEEQKSWTQLSQISRILLSLISSPENAKRFFSKTAYLTKSRRNLLSVRHMCQRLIFQNKVCKCIFFAPNLTVFVFR